MIVDLKLTFPSGLATAVLINGFHTQEDKMAKYPTLLYVHQFSFVAICMSYNVEKFFLITFLFLLILYYKRRKTTC